MDVLDLARWQFGITTVYHFFFVPLTIGLSVLVASMQTIAWRTGSDQWYRLTAFFGKLFLINFALGIATGIVQEFQFGMNWSDYSRFVGDVFGAPLAIEGLLAFFLESTFLGLWIFGKGRLSPGLHLACIWVAALGTVLSAYFILAANSFMQNPVGFELDPVSGRAELTDIGAVLTNPVLTVTFPHQIFGCFMVAGAFVAGVAMWQLLRHPSRDAELDPAGSAVSDSAGSAVSDSAGSAASFRPALKMGAVVLLVAGLGTVISGDFQGKVMTEVQPMKMAAAEGLYEDAQPAPFSAFTVGTLDGSEPLFQVEVPRLLSVLGTGTLDGEVRGIDSLQAEYEQRYGAGDYSPNIPVTYWSFRLMITAGGIAMAMGALMLWMTRGGRTPSLARPSGRWLLRAAIVLPLLPLAANSFGWIFTEMGRQPWVVFGLMRTADGVSPGTSMTEIVVSLATFTTLYATLAVIEVRLLLTYIGKGLPDTEPPVDVDNPDAPLSYAY